MKLTINIPDLVLARLLQAAYEGGVGHWCENIKCFAGDDPIAERTIDPCDRRFYMPLRDGKWIIVDRVTKNRHVLNHATLERGVELLMLFHPQKIPDLVAPTNVPTPTDSAELGDLLIQLSLFGMAFPIRSRNPVPSDMKVTIRP